VDTGEHVDRPRTYLYAILADEVESDLGPVETPHGSAPVMGIRAGGLTALISPHTGPPIERLSREDILRALVAHQGVIEQVMANHPMLPVRFGTVLDSEDTVRQVLSTFRRRLGRALGDIAGAVEIDLSATWELPEIIGEIKEEPLVAALAGAAGEDGGQAGLATRIEAGKLVHEALERRREAYRHGAVDTLRPLVRDMHRNPVPAEDLVLNLALLVDRERLVEVDAAVDGLASEWDGRVAFRYVGPLPPYSFATVVLGTLEPPQLGSAVQVLGLPREATRPEIRLAYRRLAAEYHPDRNAGDPRASDRFAALGMAYRLLNRYLEGQRTGDESEDGSAVYDLAPEGARDRLLLEIAEDDSPAGFGPEG